MLIARFASRKNSLIKVIRTEKNSSPFKVCLKDNFETHAKKKHFFQKKTSKSFYYPINSHVYIKQTNFLTQHPAVLRGAVPTCR